ncbi:hypothetical protein PHYPO_G00064060 [Pangasianodon hypophthalmus]|uniref:Uncharacterized protein n=1 Tax=Pangasianodon hypophthalmus TaxID=310915 RepID=A0A5N5M1U1_PANHP|nr:hypothetical protein PHYPO_G00064060 [Pangasianodon hypophthalmus]
MGTRGRGLCWEGGGVCHWENPLPSHSNRPGATWRTRRGGTTAPGYSEQNAGYRHPALRRAQKRILVEEKRKKGEKQSTLGLVWICNFEPGSERAVFSATSALGVRRSPGPGHRVLDTKFTNPRSPVQLLTVYSV